MGELLYLDTARLGRMSPGARRAHHDFTELAGEEGGSAYFERFLAAGLDALPDPLRARYPGLAHWAGVGPLKAALRRLAGGPRPDLPVLLANRSAQLMKLAARLLFHPCRNVLATDLDWPGYRDVLAAECHRANRAVTVVPVRRAVDDDRVAEGELVRLVCEEFARRGCDGLFLTAVSHDGVRLPVGPIVRALEAAHRVWFVVVDGAQDFCHAGADLSHCDLYLAGGHKWLGAYHPLGIAFYGRRRSRGMVETVLADMAASGDLDDPLLRVSGRLEAGSLGGPVETVSLAPLFSCQGAAADRVPQAGPPAERLAGRLENLAAAAELATGAGWRPVLPDPALRSGILLLRPGAGVGREPPDLRRLRFRERGVALTAYEDGSVRLSMPADAWSAEERDVLRQALEEVPVLRG